MITTKSRKQKAEIKEIRHYINKSVSVILTMDCTYPDMGLLKEEKSTKLN